MARPVRKELVLRAGKLPMGEGAKGSAQGMLGAGRPVGRPLCLYPLSCLPPCFKGLLNAPDAVVCRAGHPTLLHRPVDPAFP